MGVIYFLSAQSNLVLPVEVSWSGLLSWIAHFTEYAVLASLLWLALRSSPRLARHATAIAFALVALHALSDEVHQSFVPGRMPDVPRLAGGPGRCSFGNLVAFSFTLLATDSAKLISCLFAPVLLQ